MTTAQAIAQAAAILARSRKLRERALLAMPVPRRVS